MVGQVEHTMIARVEHGLELDPLHSDSKFRELVERIGWHSVA
jgi:hypothetical protein